MAVQGAAIPFGTAAPAGQTLGADGDVCKRPAAPVGGTEAIHGQGRVLCFGGLFTRGLVMPLHRAESFGGGVS